ncbi:MAG: VWA domain-containing protein, partial [Planctomycetales bacterium]|nr:VWA domain-containing protein [Planctomycetales bacterium]
TTVGEIGALFGKDGQGMSDVGDGLKAAATFFGAKSVGSRFVFVVDNSNSMGSGKFETVMNELVRTIDTLGPNQRFYVIFFSDVAYPLFHPQPAYDLVKATPENKARLRAWLYTVEMCLRTKGREAMEKALSLRPDAIYILGDGAFTDDTANMLTAPHNRRVVIHTVGMQVDERGRKQLTAIAEANKGSFRNVEATPAAKAMARQNPIKRNNTRGPVWGIDLPLVKKK